MRPSLKKVLIVFIATEALLAAVNLASYFGRFDGDPLIHVAFAENASRGLWFQFNPGQPVSGVTSLAWLGAGALGWAMSGIRGCLLLYDALILVSWLGGALCLAFLVRRWGGGRLMGFLAAAVFLGYPGVAANGLTGMENMTFAFLVFLFVLAYAVLDERRRRGDRTTPLEAGIGVLLGLAILTRPEGIALAASFAAVEVFPVLSTAGREAVRTRWRSLLLCGAVCAAIVLPFGILHWLATGSVVPGSGIARLMHSRRLATSIHLAGPLWFYPRTLARLATYLPVAAGLLSALWLSRPRRRPAQVAPDEAGRASFVLAVGTAVLGIALYSFVTGAVHTNRYTIWIVGLATAVTFALAGRRLQAATGRASKVVPALLLAGVSWMLILHAGETRFRLRRGDQTKLLSRSEITAAVDRRKENTDELLRAVDEAGCRPSSGKAGILLQEVQARLAYDDRVTVFSRDGRTDPLSFDASGCPDLAPLLRSPDLLAIMDDINAGTIEGCVRDPEGLRLSELYRDDGLREIPGWRKVLLKRYWRGETGSGPYVGVFPVLVRTCR